VCPTSTINATSSISLNLDSACSLTTMATSSKKKYNDFVKAFEKDCKGNRNCDFSILSSLWPDECKAKIGTSQISNSASLSDSQKQTALTNAAGTTILQAFATVECTSSAIDLRNGFGMSTEAKETASPMSRDMLGLVVVIIDCLIMFYFLVVIWFIQYYVKVETDRHRNLLFEVSEFALYFGNLPKVRNNFSVEMLKSELWNHIETVIKDYPQQIERLKDSTTSAEIVDI